MNDESSKYAGWNLRQCNDEIQRLAHQECASNGGDLVRANQMVFRNFPNLVAKKKALLADESAAHDRQAALANDRATSALADKLPTAENLARYWMQTGSDIGDMSAFAAARQGVNANNPDPQRVMANLIAYTAKLRNVDEKQAEHAVRYNHPALGPAADSAKVAAQTGGGYPAPGQGFGPQRDFRGPPTPGDAKPINPAPITGLDVFNPQKQGERFRKALGNDGAPSVFRQTVLDALRSRGANLPQTCNNDDIRRAAIDTLRNLGVNLPDPCSEDDIVKAFLSEVCQKQVA